MDAAIREAREEIGLDITANNLKLISVKRHNITALGGAIENEFCWVYTLQIVDNVDLTLQTSEVASLSWKKLQDFKAEITNEFNEQYVPHGAAYFQVVINSVENAQKSNIA